MAWVSEPSKWHAPEAGQSGQLPRVPKKGDPPLFGKTAIMWQQLVGLWPVQAQDSYVPPEKLVILRSQVSGGSCGGQFPIQSIATSPPNAAVLVQLPSDVRGIARLPGSGTMKRTHNTMSDKGTSMDFSLSEAGGRAACRPATATSRWYLAQLRPDQPRPGD